MTSKIILFLMSLINVSINIGIECTAFCMSHCITKNEGNFVFIQFNKTGTKLLTL